MSAQLPPNPTHGARYVLHRIDGPVGTPIAYDGVVHRPDADLPVRVDLARGEPSLCEGHGLSADEARLTLGFVKAALRGEAPRKLVRWR